MVEFIFEMQEFWTQGNLRLTIFSQKSLCIEYFEI